MNGQSGGKNLLSSIAEKVLFDGFIFLIGCFSFNADLQAIQ